MKGPTFSLVVRTASCSCSLGSCLPSIRSSAESKRQFTHKLGLLGHGRVQRPIANGLQAGHVAVEAKDPDLSANVGHLHRVRGSQRQGVCAAKKGINIGETLKHVLGNGKPLILHPGLAGLLGHHLDSRAFGQRLVEAFVAVHFGCGAFLTLQDGQIGFTVGHLADVFAQGLGRLRRCRWR